MATMLTVLGMLMALLSGVLAQGRETVGRLEERVRQVEEQAGEMQVRIEHRLTRIETKIDALGGRGAGVPTGRRSGVQALRR